MPLLTRNPFTAKDVPPSGSPEYHQWIDKIKSEALRVVECMGEWRHNGWYEGNVVNTATLSTDNTLRNGRPTSKSTSPASSKDSPSPSGSEHTPPLSIAPTEVWVGRRSTHYLSHHHPSNSTTIHDTEIGEMKVVSPSLSTSRRSSLTSSWEGSIFEAFQAGMFKDHTLHEKEYIESLKEVELLETHTPNEAEIYRVAYSMPYPFSSRSFLFLIITIPLPDLPPPPMSLAQPLRQFLVITLPYESPQYPLQKGKDQGKLRGKYVSVELIREKDVILSGHINGAVDGGERIIRGVEWSVCTSSEAGGNIPQAMVNKSLPAKMSEDVPSFISWLEKRYPSLVKVESKKMA